MEQVGFERVDEETVEFSYPLQESDEGKKTLCLYMPEYL